MHALLWVSELTVHALLWVSELTVHALLWVSELTTFDADENPPVVCSRLSQTREPFFCVEQTRCHTFEEVERPTTSP